VTLKSKSEGKAFFLPFLGRTATSEGESVTETQSPIRCQRLPEAPSFYGRSGRDTRRCSGIRSSGHCPNRGSAGGRTALPSSSIATTASFQRSRKVSLAIVRAMRGSKRRSLAELSAKPKIGPEIDGQAREVRRTQRSRFGHGRADDRHSENVGLKLHQAVVGGCAAIHSQLLHRVAGIADAWRRARSATW
jgi:hypothetical protein